MSFDVAVIGAGSFGAWTAWHLRRAGRRVLLVDAYGAANSRASSGGESRIIRMGYGPREIYTRWSIRSMEQWVELQEIAGDRTLFSRCGTQWIAPPGDPFALEMVSVLERCGVSFERELRPSPFRFSKESWGIFEPSAGALLARRAIQKLAAQLIAQGVTWRQARVEFGDIESLRAEHVVFACGPWLPKVFPDLLGKRIVPSRQEVFFFGTPAGTPAFEQMPCWIDIANKFYGLPDLENRGLKIAYDVHGNIVDPDTLDRIPSAEGLARARAYLAEHCPLLRDAPVLEARVCQYENTANGDYLLDRHPDHKNVWIAGGGSGHGFKHGPAVGEYMANLILGTGEAEPKFSLAAKPEAAESSTRSSFYRN